MAIPVPEVDDEPEAEPEEEADPGRLGQLEHEDGAHEDGEGRDDMDRRRLERPRGIREPIA